MRMPRWRIRTMMIVVAFVAVTVTATMRIVYQPLTIEGLSHIPPSERRATYAPVKELVLEVLAGEEPNQGVAQESTGKDPASESE